VKNHVRKLTLSTLAFALVPLAQANAVTIFDSSTTAWTGESSLSTTTGGSSTFTLPASSATGGSQGADYFTLPSAITTGSGVWTFNTSATFNIPTPPATTNNNFINIGVGFGNYVTTSSVVNSSGTASANGTGGPWIGDTRDFYNPQVSYFATLHGGSGSTPPTSPTFVLEQSSSPEAGKRLCN